MTVRQLLSAQFRTGLLTASAGVAMGLMAASPAASLSDSQQLLLGGAFATAGATIYTAPGIPFAQLATDLGGKGEGAVQIRMPAGTLSGLKVKVTTETAPSGGTFTFTVRKNGADTTLTCSLTKAGNCNSSESVAVANNDKISVKVTNTFTGATTTKFTFTLLFD